MEPTKEQVDWIAQTRRGVLELCLLIALDKGPQYGYQLLSELARWPVLEAPEGTVYPLLRRLERTGQLTSTWRESQAGPPRKYYSLTRSGRRELASKAAQWEAISQSVAELKRAGGVLNETRI